MFDSQIGLMVGEDGFAKEKIRKPVGLDKDSGATVCSKEESDKSFRLMKQCS